MSNGVQRLFFFPDMHVPYHSEKALRLALRVRKAFRPHRTIILGDMADFYCVSSYDKSPARKDSLQWEVQECNKVLDLIDQHKDRRDFVAGNHEFRLERYLKTKAPETFDMLKVQDLLRLKERGWSYTPYQHSLKIGRLWITHDEGTAGPTAHRKARDSFGGNVVIGHTHRMSVDYQGCASGKGHVGAMFGWLGDPEAVDYLHRVKAQQWIHGVGVGYLLPSGNVHLQAIPFIEGKAVLPNGKILSA